VSRKDDCYGSKAALKVALSYVWSPPTSRRVDGQCDLRLRASKRLQRSRFASVAGLNIYLIVDKLFDNFERLIAVEWPKPNSAHAAFLGLPAAVVAHLALSEMCSGTLSVRVAIDKISGHVPLDARMIVSLRYR
jgi:hypothetical protein